MQIRNRIRLLRGLWSREYAYTAPVSVTIDVTRRCNLRCSGCPSHSPHLDTPLPVLSGTGDFDVDMFGKLCGELKSMGSENMIFSGDGEPLLHPRLLDLIGLARGAGLRTVLLTNGTLFTPENVRSLIDSGLNLVRVSLWATTPEEYEKNYPGTNPRFLQSALSGLSLLASTRAARDGASLRVTLLTVLNRINCRAVDSFVSIAIQARAGGMLFAQMRTLNGRLAGLALSREEEAAVIGDLRRAGERLRSAGLNHNIEETIRRFEIGEAVRAKIPCYIAWLHPCIKVDGAVLPCGPCAQPVGSLRERSFREIWNGAGYREFRQRLSDPAEAAYIDQHCDCTFCCHVPTNENVHRYYRWLSPLAAFSGMWQR
jgi:MoaA/NifB/PqqE/SkfB family radical SAM enzyme